MGLWLLELIAGAFITSRIGSVDPGAYSVQLMGFAGMAWVVVTQLKCQFANYYGASLSLANFSTRILKRAWGRRTKGVLVVWTPHVPVRRRTGTGRPDRRRPLLGMRRREDHSGAALSPAPRIPPRPAVPSGRGRRR
jgi:hypothetical protein